MSRIYLVDDEQSIRELLSYNLRQSGHEVLAFADGMELLSAIDVTKPELVILDLMLPDLDGIEICRRLRKNPTTGDLPILMLTAKTSEFDMVLGLEAGADDYLRKPFSINELLARVRALLRRSVWTNPEPAGIDIGDLSIDRSGRQVWLGEEPVKLTLKEFELLTVLAEHPKRAYSRDQLLQQIWGYEYSGDTRTVDVHIHSLRKAIGESHIETVRGIGYRFSNPKKGEQE